MPRKKSSVSKSKSNLLNSEVVEHVHENKSQKPFLFTDQEIAMMPDFVRNVVLLKKEGGFLIGANMLIWKLSVGVKVAQTQPFILKYVGINGTRCKICGKAVAWAAKCTWMDRFYNRKTGTKEEKLFVINDVCESCLKATDALYLHHAEWLDLILMNRESAQYDKMNNAKDYVCEICNEHSTDSTWIHIPAVFNVKSMLLTLAVCEKHFDLLVVAKGANSELLDSVDVAAKLVETGCLSRSVLEELKAYRRITNKGAS